MDSISITIKPEDVDNTLLDSSIYSEMETISPVLKSEIKEETNLDHSVPQSGETSCDLKTEVEEKTKHNSLFVDASSTLNSSGTTLDAINFHENFCTNKSSKQDKSERIKEANQKLIEMKQSAEKRLRDIVGEEVLQISAFQQKPCNCSLKQAAVTRFSMKSDKMQDKQVNVQKDHSELVKQLMTGRPGNILREQVSQMQDKQVNVQKDPCELEKEPMTQLVEMPRNVIGEQDLQMQGRKRDEQSTDDIHRILHKDQVLQMLVKQVGVQKDHSELIKESMTQSTEDWLRSMLREQDLPMQDIPASNGLQEPVVTVISTQQPVIKITEVAINPRIEMAYRNLLSLLLAPSSLSSKSQSRSIRGSDVRNHDDAVAMETPKDGERTIGNQSLARVMENEIQARVMENRNEAYSMEADEQVVLTQKTPETIEEIAIAESDSEGEPRSEKTVVDSALKKKGVKRPKGVKRKKGVKGQKEFICDTCNMKFTRHILICNHVLKHLHNGRLFACRRCFKKFTTLQDRNLHEKTHNDRNPVICDKCGVQFPSTTYLFSHEIKVHGKSKPYLCHLCGKSFYTKKDLQKHGLVHAKLDKLVDHGKKVSYLCDTCGKSFKQRSDLNRHGLVHSGEKNFECKHCNKRLSSPLVLNRHLKTHQKFACDICSETFEGKKRLLRHKRIHNKKAYQCDQCEASFDQNCNLTKHKIIHSGLKPYKCHICEYSAAHRSNLNKHLKTAHNLTPNS